jgi:acetyl esterase/lipase
MKKYGSMNLEAVKEMEKMVEDKMAANKPKKDWKIWKDQCDIQDIVIPGGDGQNMKIQIIKTKQNKDQKNLPGFISCHGGGATILSYLVGTDYCCK